MQACPNCQTELSPTARTCPACGVPITEFLRRYSTELLDGKYQILSILGVGGMGEVYKARHVHLDAIRVIKLMRPAVSADLDANDRFLREARLATRIQHPNVAALFDFSALPDGSFYMVWEFIDGVNLRQYAGERGFLAQGEAVELSVQALHGLEAIHRAGIVHRDISPENIMVARDANGSVHAKLIDLGVAKQSEGRDEETKTGIFVGKFKYCSPEQLGMLGDGERIDGRADLYSFALVAYEMMTGVPPFQAETPHQYLVLHASHMPKTMRAANPAAQITPQIEAVVFRALRKDRDQRFASAMEFARALESATPADTIIEPLPGPTDSTLVVSEIPRTLSTPSESSGSRVRPLRAGATDPALLRKRDLADQLAAAIDQEQYARGDVILQTLRMHLGVAAESDLEYRRLRNLLEARASSRDGLFAEEIERAKAAGKPKDVQRILLEREEKIGRKFGTTFRVATDSWLRRRAELLAKTRNWISIESFGLAADAIDELMVLLGEGSTRDEEFVALTQWWKQAVDDAASKMAREITATHAQENIIKTRRLLSMFDGKFGNDIEKPESVARAERWLAEIDSKRGPTTRVESPVVIQNSSGGAGRLIVTALLVLLLACIGASYVWKAETADIVRRYAPPAVSRTLLPLLEDSDQPTAAKPASN